MFAVTAGQLDSSAPGALGLLEAFCNTLDRRSFRTHGTTHEPHDDLADAVALSAWLRRNGLLRRGETAATDRDLKRAKRLRAALRDTIARHDPPVPRTTGTRRGDPDRVLREFPHHPVVSRAGIAFEPAHRGIRGALAVLAGAAAQATIDRTWQRMRMCAAPDCQWVYFDRSRNRAARWCSMSTCGNREKTRRYRHRPGTQQAGNRG